MAVAILTDSAASIPPDEADRAGVMVVPLRLTIGGRSYRDTEIPLEEVVRRVEEGVTTSGPTPGDIAEAIEARLGPDGALILTVARALSGVYEVARLAARRFGDRVRVFDTDTASGAQGLVVRAAAEQAAAGRSLDDVEGAARHVSRRVRLVAALRGLDWLVKSGHVPGIAAWAGRSLGLHPIIELGRGRVRPLRPARSEESAVQRILSEWRASRPNEARAHVVALHALAPERAQALLEAIRAEIDPATALLGPFSSVMVAHTGPGVVGLAWWWEEP